MPLAHGADGKERTGTSCSMSRVTQAYERDVVLRRIEEDQPNRMACDRMPPAPRRSPAGASDVHDGRGVWPRLGAGRGGAVTPLPKRTVVPTSNGSISFDSVD